MSARALARENGGRSRRQSTAPVRAKLDRLSTLGIALLASILLVTPLLIGGVHLWAIGLFEIVTWLLAAIVIVVWSGRSSGGERVEWRRAATLFGSLTAVLFAYLAFQLVPLPRDVVGWLSPAMLDLRARTIDAVLGFDSQGGAPLAFYPFRAAVDLSRYAAYAVVLFAAAALPRPRATFRALGVTGAVMAGLAIVQNVAWNGKLLWVFTPYDGAAYPRMSGPYVNPDHFAMLMELTIFAAAAELMMSLERSELDAKRSQRAARRLLLVAVWLVAVALMAAGVVGSASRGGLVGALLGLVLFSFPSYRRREPAPRSRRRAARWQRWERLGSVLRLCAPALVAVVVIVGGLGYAGSESRRILDVRLGRSILAPDLDLRVHHWAQTLPMLADFPVVGVGLRGWREVFPRYESFPVLGRQPNHAHNDYLEWVAEVGAIGVVLSLFAAAAYFVWLRRTKNVPHWVRRAVVASILALSWHEFFDFGLRVSSNALALAILLGLRVNPGWQEAGATRSEAGVPLRRLAFAALPLVLLTWWSVGLIREWGDWRRAKNGETPLSISPAAETLQEIARRARAREEREDLREAATRALRGRFFDGESYWHLALAERDRGRQLRALEAALVADPTNSIWRLSYAVALEDLGRVAAARREVIEAFRRDPRPYVHGALSPANSAIGREIRAAIEEGLRLSVRDSGDDPDLLHVIASFYYHPFERWAQAAEAWVRAAEVSGDWDTYGSWAVQALGRAKRFDEAEEVAARALSAAPANAEIYRMLALEVHVPREKFDEAESVLEEGLRRASAREFLYLALSYAKAERGDLVGAVEALERGIERYRRSATLQGALGQAFLRREDFLRAKNAFGDAAALEPNQGLYLYYAGYAAERLYAVDEARGLYQRAIALEPGNEEYRQALRRVQTAFEE